MKLKQIIIAAALLVVPATTVMASAAIAKTDGVECSVLPQSICNAAEKKNLEQSGIWKLSIWVINILTVGVGVAAVAAIAFAGFLYTTARDDPGQTKKAIEMIRNTVIGLVVYIFMYAGLQYLIPGGIFS